MSKVHINIFLEENHFVASYINGDNQYLNGISAIGKSWLDAEVNLYSVLLAVQHERLKTNVGVEFKIAE